MIVYDKLWVTMKEKGVSQYKLIKEYHIRTGQLDRLRKNGIAVAIPFFLFSNTIGDSNRRICRKANQKIIEMSPCKASLIIPTATRCAG